MYEDYAVYDPASAAGTTGDTIIGAYGWLVTIAYFLYVMVMQYKIAHRTGQADTAWWAFIPILNSILLIYMAGKPLKWFWLLLIPFVNLIAFFALWINVARNCGQSGFWGFSAMIPLVNLIALFVLAMSSRPYSYPECMDETGPGSQNRSRSTPQVR